MKNKKNNLKKFFDYICEYKNNKKIKKLFNINSKYINQILQSNIKKWKKINEQIKNKEYLKKIIKKYVKKNNINEILIEKIRKWLNKKNG